MYLQFDTLKARELSLTQLFIVLTSHVTLCSPLGSQSFCIIACRLHKAPALNPHGEGNPCHIINIDTEEQRTQDWSLGHTRYDRDGIGFISPKYNLLVSVCKITSYSPAWAQMGLHPVDKVTQSKFAVGYRIEGFPYIKKYWTNSFAWFQSLAYVVASSAATVLFSWLEPHWELASGWSEAKCCVSKRWTCRSNILLTTDSREISL